LSSISTATGSRRFAVTTYNLSTSGALLGSFCGGCRPCRGI
jgi:hypothetical protein